MGLMMLAACEGSTIHLQAQGKEAAKAIEVLTSLISKKFGEDD